MAILTHIQRNNLDVLYFSGKINDGEYGAGTIDIIERLPYEILEWDRNDSKILFFHIKLIRIMTQIEYFIV